MEFCSKRKFDFSKLLVKQTTHIDTEEIHRKALRKGKMVKLVFNKNESRTLKKNTLLMGKRRHIHQTIWHILFVSHSQCDYSAPILVIFFF